MYWENKKCFDNVTASESIRRFGKIQTYRLNRFIHEIPASRTNTSKKNTSHDFDDVITDTIYSLFIAFFRIYSKKKKTTTTTISVYTKALEHWIDRSTNILDLVQCANTLLWLRSAHTDSMWLGYEHEACVFLLL